MNLRAPTASFTAPYPNEAALQAYLKRVLDVTLNQGFIKQGDLEGWRQIDTSANGCSRRSLEPMSSLENPFLLCLQLTLHIRSMCAQRILEATSTQGLNVHSTRTKEGLS